MFFAVVGLRLTAVGVVVGSVFAVQIAGCGLKWQ